MNAGTSTTSSNGPALDLMLGFAERTGLTSERAPQRYLWTDAFAVCNFLGLGQTELALRLIDQVHRTLSPMPDEAHPTRAGLRIGKPLPERGPDEPFDERLEWERDGQYFHYLTRWMHALDQTTRFTGEPKWNRWARELAEVAHRAFTRGNRMVWKMSVDLSRPQVASMGQHDPLDGHITYLQLDATASAMPARTGPRLDVQAAELAAMIPAQLATTDPLGLGGLLADAHRVEQLGPASFADHLLERLLDAALVGLTNYGRSGELELPPVYRLAFRELGLAIGLAAIPSMRSAAQLAPYAPLAAEITAFWLRPEHRRTIGWRDHANINDVMLATSLAPAGHLTLR